ncbi:MAG: hypothetical protein FWC69_03620, partial [Defluviitaleaceae bacterium]|nr:hypothetical protein [Defluviitaleaceae bacterium]
MYMKKLAACLAIALCVIISTNSLPFVADVDLGDAPFSNFFDEMLDEEVYEPETEEESDIVDEGEEVQVEDEIESDENAEENEDVEYEKEEKEEEEGLEGEKVGEKAAEGQVNIINPMQEGVIDFTPTAFTWLEGSDPNIWYETPDYEITLAAAPAGTAFTRLLTLIRNAEPDAITHIIIPFHINTGPITGDVTTVRVPDGATVVLVGAHPTAANEQVVISDSHGGTNIS